eukprot:TRINITY_DN21288_c0_g1_i1.p1 TRINITY_DN21288_c0_g1~~TRINITY_DN21288_c0_g1_i1.p1  ORF type:complete len:294 (+),score=12.96 TRINITY_DN21288_c0_g1_i1:117-998(+)
MPLDVGDAVVCRRRGGDQAREVAVVKSVAPDGNRRKLLVKWEGDGMLEIVDLAACTRFEQIRRAAPPSELLGGSGGVERACRPRHASRENLDCPELDVLLRPGSGACSTEGWRRSLRSPTATSALSALSGSLPSPEAGPQVDAATRRRRVRSLSNSSASARKPQPRPHRHEVRSQRRSPSPPTTRGVQRGRYLRVAERPQSSGAASKLQNARPRAVPRDSPPRRSTSTVGDLAAWPVDPEDITSPLRHPVNPEHASPSGGTARPAPAAAPQCGRSARAIETLLRAQCVQPFLF